MRAVFHVPVCDERLIDGRVWECKKTDNDHAELRPRSNGTPSCDGHPYASVWREETLQFTCAKGGVKEFMGCFTSGIFVPNGEMKSVDGSNVECKKHENGSITMEVRETPNNTKCKDSGGRERKEGSEWKEGSVQYKCGKEGMKELMGCITTSGVLILEEEVKSVDGYDIECKKRANGSITMQVLGRSKKKCKDSSGREWEEGSEWEEYAVKYKCGNDGKKVSMGCITASRVPIREGEVKSVDGYDIECKKRANGSITMQVLGRSKKKCKDSSGREWEEGSEWEEYAVKYKCGNDGKKVSMGCITASRVPIREGEVKSVDGYDLECKKYANGYTALLPLRRSKKKCKDSSGREWEEGSEWKEGSVQYKCGKEGMKELMGCITTSGVLIREGELKSVDGYHFECKRRANGYTTMPVLEKYECKGEVWRETQRVEGEYRCDRGGVRTVLGCITGGTYIHVNYQAHVWGANHKCISDIYGAKLERQCK
ncbi:unnamed protein product [Angiostrongylus costaricensis]|uniref:Fibronectin type-II domain-containing protein n=1 Tax=Angiostrongylus costaricensis TaxID=334426 RepID=A0A158PDH4_ANGCS|nr:unnamed protein product [Angiostrongylus costaricensis]